MDKQNIINDILQMSETNPAMAAQQQHRGIGTGMGPTSESHTYLEKENMHTRVSPLRVVPIILKLDIKVFRKYYHHEVIRF